MHLGAGREIAPVHPVKPRDQCTDVRFGPIADIAHVRVHVRFTPNSGHGSGTAVMSALCHKRTLLNAEALLRSG